MFRIMKNRLQQFINAENISQSQFADRINVARGSVSHIISGRNKPSYEFIQAMIEHFPMVNVEWLMTGKGKMYKDVTKVKEVPSAPENLFTATLVTEETGGDNVVNAVLPGNGPYPEQKTQPQSDMAPEKAAQNIDNQQTIKKIVVFYTNGTFEEFTR